MGRYGQKTGAGWYTYAAGSRTPVPDPQIDRIAEEEAARRAVARRAVSDDEILARTTMAVINEGAKVLEEGIAARPGDIDVIYCFGFGFPRRRGGPMFYADTIGLPTVLVRIEHFRRRLGDHWRPAPLLVRRAAESHGFYGGPSPAAVSA
jgi:3-hydroxyacyl-CoA dehydrogenase